MYETINRIWKVHIIIQSVKLFILCKYIYRILCSNAAAVPGFVGDVGDLELFS